MTVTATSYTPITYNGNGSTTVFNVTFQFYEIAVIHIDSSGSETEWTENTHYTVTGGEGSTGSITVTTTAPATGEKLRIERRTSKDQPRDYDLDNAVLEAALQQSDDRLAMILQELDYDNRRRPAISTANFTAEVEFPTASTGSVLSWAADGNLANTALVDLDGVAISALTAATELEDTDLFPIYDNGAGDNAAITWANVKTAVSAFLNLGTLAGLDELPDDSLTAAKIPDGEIPAEKLANSSLGSNQMLDAAEDLGDVDWDTVLTNGLYRADQSTNNPLGSDTRWWIGQVIAHNSIYVTQELWDFTNANGHYVYRRYMLNGVWQSWHRIIAVATGSISPHTLTAAVNFNGTGTVSIRDSFNIQSITDLGTGSYRLNFANAMSNTDYVVVATARRGDNVMVTALNYTVNSVDIKTVDGPGVGTGIAFYNYDCDPINVAIFGGDA